MMMMHGRRMLRDDPTRLPDNTPDAPWKPGLMLWIAGDFQDAS